MASALCHSSTPWCRYGCQGFDSPNLRRRELPGCYSRWIGHELANVDCFRYLSRFLCQLGRLQRWGHHMASTIGICHASRTSSPRRCLLLPRITSMVHQEGPILQRFPIALPSPKYSTPGGSGSLLHPCSNPRGGRHHWQEQLHHPLH